ncbi:MAG: hypothetical protein P1P83_10415 [Bacteroidales bacterium]|nr:hypothetical protein [Bacteroidales bacterium]MDT8374402.1 hypothetical protein [Bacteroidales bacterium]
MKKLFILLALLMGTGTLWSQEKESILFTGSYEYMPEYRMQGAGYTVSYQHNLKPWLSLEAGGGYTLASRTIERNQTVNNVTLLDLNYHHAAYSLYAAPGLKAGKGRAVSVDLFAGPVIAWQSNVFDLNRYEMPEGPAYTGSMTDIVYVNRVLEGTFFGGIAGCRVNIRTGENWSLNFGANAMGIIKAVSSVNATLGIKYSW